MSNSKTVFVLGAGASKEAKLPDGRELTKKISSYLDYEFKPISGIERGDRLIFEALQADARKSGIVRKLDDSISAARAIRDAMPQAMSIDNYIDHHNGNKSIELCGKLAITRAILEAENKSSLYVDMLKSNAHPNYQNLSETWFNGFFQLLTDNCRVEDLNQRIASVVLIVFNYDRCIEQFLYHSFQNYHRVSPDDAAALVNSMAIYHPYGTVGQLQWQGKGKVVNFGNEPSGPQLLELATQIRTFTEGTNERSSEISAIRQNVSDARILVFLGFAFHHLNLELLFHGERVGRITPGACYATAYGISESNSQLIKNELVNLTGLSPTLVNIRKDLTCCALLQDYRRSLSLKR